MKVQQHRICWWSVQFASCLTWTCWCCWLPYPLLNAMMPCHAVPCVTPCYTCRYPLEQLPEAIKVLLGRRVQGKVIITMGGSGGAGGAGGRAGGGQQHVQSRL